jgi:hypothetical protein
MDISMALRIARVVLPVLSPVLVVLTSVGFCLGDLGSESGPDRSSVETSDRLVARS